MAYIGRSTDGFGVRNRFLFVADASDTSVSGADANGATLTFTDGAYVDVYLNGVLLKAGTDYNTNTANTIAGLSALSANDEVTVLVYDIFSVADTVSATSGGTFSGAVTLSGGVSSSLTVANGLTLTDGDVTVASGHGISFASTSDATGMQNELFDDYEEGVFQTAITPSTSGSVTLKSDYDDIRYTKIGRLVTINADLRIHTTSSPNGGLYINIPFTSKDDNANVAAQFGTCITHSITKQTDQVGRFVILSGDNLSYIMLQYETTASRFQPQAQNMGLAQNDEIVFSLTYTV
jgi:hypothetical protein